MYINIIHVVLRAVGWCSICTLAHFSNRKKHKVIRLTILVLSLQGLKSCI